ncbi:MAG: hypothetical protein K8T20_01960 [Planctomycetes bacterium]|nr:hypothetical protein [Planctomycetota bacterium]
MSTAPERVPPFEPWLLEIRDRFAERIFEAALPEQVRIVLKQLGLPRFIQMYYRVVAGWTAELDTEVDDRIGRLRDSPAAAVADRLRSSCEARELNRAMGVPASMLGGTLDEFKHRLSLLGSLAWSEAVRLDPGLADRWLLLASQSTVASVPGGGLSVYLFEGSDMKSRAGFLMLEQVRLR